MAALPAFWGNLGTNLCKQVPKLDFYEGTSVGQDEATLSGCVAENSVAVPDPLFFNEDIIIKE